MIHDRIKKRLRKNRPMTSITLRIQQDVVDDLKEMAPLLGFSGYQALLKAYVSDGMRRDEARLFADAADADEHGNAPIETDEAALRRVLRDELHRAAG